MYSGECLLNGDGGLFRPDADSWKGALSRLARSASMSTEQQVACLYVFGDIAFD